MGGVMGMKYTWEELCVMEAAKRAKEKARKGKSFDQDIFDAVACMELKKLRGEVAYLNS
jgi:hypothetical protein